MLLDRLLEDGFGSPRALGFHWYCFFLSGLKLLSLRDVNSSLLQLQLLEKEGRLCLWISRVLFGMTF